MRTQEVHKFKDLCNRYDEDWQNWDLRNIDYQTAVHELFKKVGIVTEEMEREEFEAYLSLASWYDSLSLEEKASITTNLITEQFPPNVLVLFVPRRYANLALQILRWKFNGNILKSKNGKEKIDKRKGGSMTVWMFGKKKTTEAIKTELKNHNLYFRILRDCPLRRDFLHFWRGRLYPVSRKVLRILIEPQSKI